MAMYGLLISQPLLDRLLNGGETGDVRAFCTDKRGRIALVDPADSCVKGFADITGVKTVPYSEYRRQHGQEITGDMWAAHRNYYRIEFARVARIERPQRIELRGETVWVEVPGTLEQGRKQSSLLDF